MKKTIPFLGVIEGFYGRCWPPAVRLLMARWLPALGIDGYLYAPKSDRYLRREWRSPWPRDERAHLVRLTRECHQTGLAFHVGLSPYAAYLDYGRPVRNALRAKIAEICDLGVTGIAVLFDDMPGDLDSLASRQAEICADIQHWAGGSVRELRVCPTYYSEDPVLDEFFGVRPPSYIQTLCSDLDRAFEVFWTGPRVCSESIDAASLADVSEQCGGRLALWDNYPVNDSRTRSPHLYMADLSGRSPEIAALIASHWCNAMNQPALSLTALRSLPALYGREAPAAQEALAEAGVNESLIHACLPLADIDRDGMDDAARAALESCASLDSTAAGELRDWLAGGYQFDPNCLTD